MVGEIINKTKKIRLDKLLVERGFAPSRQKAQALILSGAVIVNEKCIDKTGRCVPIDADIRIKGEEIPYVSRGGLKLQGAIEALSISVQNKVVLDVGASTGGFTDCLLMNGASKVYAVDVGYGQLAWKLRNDPRVVVLERHNIRNLSKEDFEDEIDLATIDVSFISLRIVLPKVREICKEDGEILALIKPQFEVGKGCVGKGGIVKDEGLQRKVLMDIRDRAIELGLEPIGLIESPIKGAKGNKEFFIYLKGKKHL